MITTYDFENIIEIVKKTVDYDTDVSISLVDEPDVYVKLDGKKAFIGGENKSVCGRGVMLLLKGISEGKTEFEIRQKPHFDTCGIMIDCSRNGVMTVDAVKKYLNYMLSMGLNMFMLYTEDTYQIEGRPFFGYMRGAYSQAELKEIDDYAYSIGIEVIPCIEALAHMEQYLRWDEAKKVKDTHTVLLCESEDTYNLIEDMIKTCRSAFRTNRLHFGMDEAMGIGSGEYKKLHGEKGVHEIMNKHLNRVMEICKKYDFEPMMWSDMFFRMCAKDEKNMMTSYYEVQELDDKKIPHINDLGYVYWDYYHNTYEQYDRMFKLHKKLGDKVMFAGGIWTWTGFMPDFTQTRYNTPPALKACIDNDIKFAFATAWGDNGQECNHFYSVSGLAYFSEYNYIGRDCTEEQINSISEFVSKFSIDEMMAMTAYQRGYNEEDGSLVSAKGASLLYTHLFYNFTFQYNFDRFIEEYDKSIATLSAKPHHPSVKIYYDFAINLFKLLSQRGTILSTLLPAYRSGDKTQLINVTELIKENLKAYKELIALHRKQWLGVYKPFGYDLILVRLSGVVAEQEYVIETLDKYLNGKLDTIMELDIYHHDDKHMSLYGYHRFTTSTYIRI